MSLPEINQDNIITWALAAGVLLITLLIGFILIAGLLKLAKIIIQTSVDKATNELSATNVQRWLAFVVIMLLIIITSFDIAITPNIHITPHAPSETLVSLFLGFVLLGKAVKVWETKPVETPAPTPPVTTSTTTVVTAPVGTGIVKEETSVSNPPFILKQDE